ncbi:uncharacterized protein [Linepithema humile]|uniref:uncharacterized protein n=1 Tax=Linepithema humile TaxID=83485 RepID=UPI00351DF23E
MQKQVWPHLENLVLADPDFMSSGPIDIILGADVYPQIIEDGIAKGEATSPIAQRTSFGWVISGPANSNTSRSSSQGCHVSVDKELQDLLQRFWKLEEVSSVTSSSMSVNEQESEYEKLGHMKLIPNSQPEPTVAYYLPHHGVIRETSQTTKLRVVFNGSSRTSSGVSLNDLLYTGKKLQIDVLDVLIWFRQFRYVFFSDIEKMYRQINVHEEDQKFQRILWRNKAKDIVTYELTTVTYGLACAPFLALRTLEQLVEDKGSKFPLAVPSLVQGRYVDDIFGGADSITQAREIVQVKSLCMAGGFPLQKWLTNHSAILESISSENRIDSSSIRIDETAIIHVLGLCWNPSSDTFHFSVTVSIPSVLTKRNVLSTIAKVFDPLGLLAPILITAKIFIQELWSLKLGWDEPLPLPV